MLGFTHEAYSVNAYSKTIIDAAPKDQEYISLDEFLLIYKKFKKDIYK